jgi:hypothetical protein
VYGTSSARQAATTAVTTETADAQLIKVYPVPAHDNVVINLPAGNKQKSLITITDLNGKVYFSGNTTANTHNLDVSKFPSGVYFIQIINGGKKTVKKIVKD